MTSPGSAVFDGNIIFTFFSNNVLQPKILQKFPGNGVFLFPHFAGFCFRLNFVSDFLNFVKFGLKLEIVCAKRNLKGFQEK